ncbi:hypothetical protein LZ32DRAFT_451453 [Colletotrichum eremochloae]|nr:hypothetical protein LZ32DRAFT_451453 [Colletotrichum eremochloae]
MCVRQTKSRSPNGTTLPDRARDDEPGARPHHARVLAILAAACFDTTQPMEIPDSADTSLDPREDRNRPVRLPRSRGGGVGEHEMLIKSGAFRPGAGRPVREPRRGRPESRPKSPGHSSYLSARSSQHGNLLLHSYDIIHKPPHLPCQDACGS